MRSLPLIEPGTPFTRLTVIEFVGVINQRRSYSCRCACDEALPLAERKKVIVAGAELRAGTTKSCGCFRVEHGKNINRGHGQSGRNRTVLYRTWQSMWERPDRQEVYQRRGINVTNEWITFEAFRDYVMATIGLPPSGHTLDRIDNDRGYEPGNIRWATAKEQARNRSDNTLITVDGVTRCIAEWADVSGLTANVICQRRRHGWPDHLAVTQPRKFIRSPNKPK